VIVNFVECDLYLQENKVVQEFFVFCIISNVWICVGDSKFCRV
jgi:hypothetical protein